MTHAFGGPSGRYSGRLLSIPVGAPVRVTHFTADDGRVVQGIVGTYKGPVYDFQMARVRLSSIDAQFTSSNIAADPSAVMDLAVLPADLERTIPPSWRRARVTS